jgi:hypothetical protein
LPLVPASAVDRIPPLRVFGCLPPSRRTASGAARAPSGASPSASISVTRKGSRRAARADNHLARRELWFGRAGRLTPSGMRGVPNGPRIDRCETAAQVRDSFRGRREGDVADFRRAASRRPPASLARAWARLRSAVMSKVPDWAFPRLLVAMWLPFRRQPRNRLPKSLILWSGRRDSNPRPQPWQGPAQGVRD